MKGLIKKLDFERNKVRHIIGAVVLVLQIIATSVAIWYFNRLNVLPDKYFWLMVGVLVVCLFITARLNIVGLEPKKKNKTMQAIVSKVHILGKVFGVLVCAGLVCVCFYAHHAISLLNAITDEHYDIDIYVLSVPTDSSIQNVTDMAGKKVGVIDNMNNKALVAEALGKVKEAAGSDDITSVSYENIASLIQGLTNKEVDAILYNQNLGEMFDEVAAGFTGTIRTVGEYEVKVLITDTIEYQTEAEGGESESETETLMPPENDDIKVPVYDPSRDPFAAAGGGYIGGDNTVDNASKGPITNRTFNLYISGQDAYGKVNGRSRSDVNIIVTVNPMTKELVFTSTPRDYYVPIPGVTPSNMRDKLTHAGNYGVWTSVATLENVYEIQIDYYVKLNFTAFVQIIDALGGVEVDSPAEFTTIHGTKFAKGRITLGTGARALEFVRERHAFALGDKQRGRNQMEVLEGVIDKCMSPVILTNFTQIINSVKASVQTNMTMDEITQIVKMQLDNPASWKITQQSVTGTNGQRYCYSLGSNNSTVLPNQASINSCKAKINEVLNAQPATN